MLIMVAVLFAAATLCYAADDATMGTWKLNEAKSKLGSPAKNNTVVYAADGDNVKITVDGVDADGKPVHSEWTGKFDGKDYPATGASNHNSRAYTRVNSHTLTFKATKDGKVVESGRVVVAADGKSRTVTTTGTDASGKKVNGVAVYDKQ